MGARHSGSAPRCAGVECPSQIMRSAPMKMPAAFLALLLLGAAPEAPLSYPKTKTVDVTEDYHGVKVQDPFRWLEDLTASDTAAWIQSENAVTAGYLGQSPERAKLQARLTALWNYPRTGIPFR